MKIGNQLDAIAGGAATHKTDVVSTSTSGKTPKLDGGLDASAKVTLSSAASTLLDGTDPAFDAEKVSRIKQAIADGSYRINAEAIADKLIANSRELLSR